jgi:hypothetical protein
MSETAVEVEPLLVVEEEPHCAGELGIADRESSVPAPALSHR